MKSKEIINDEDRRLNVLEKLALSTGGMFGTFYYMMVQMFLLFFYTDILKVDPMYIAGLFLVARIIDAFITPAFGIFVDKVTTPWGKYKPWIFITSTITAVFGFLTFTDFNLGATEKTVFVTITYFIFSIGASIAAAPTAAIGPVMTKRIDDRISIGVYGYVLVMIGAMTVSVGGLPIVNILGGGNQAKGFSLFMGIAGLIFMLVTIFQMFLLKERYLNTNENKTKTSFKTLANSVIKNKTAVVFLIYVFGVNVSGGLRAAITIHYFKYYFHNEGLMVTLGIVGLVPTFIGAMLSPVFTKKLGIKNNLLINGFISIITLALTIFIPANESGVTAFIVLSVVGSLFSGLSQPAQGTMMPAAIDYAEWKMGINANGFMGSLQGFVQTFATALSGALAAAALSFIGYVPGVEQSDGTIFGLKVLMSIVPAIVTILTLVVWKFDLTEEKQKVIAHDLAERRKAAQEAQEVQAEAL